MLLKCTCGANVDFLHCMWNCPIAFWWEVSTSLSTALGLPNILHPKNCLLSIFGDLSLSKYNKQLLHILYLYVKKVVSVLERCPYPVA